MKNNSKKADRIQEPPKVAVKFANAVFVLGLIFSVFVVSLYVCEFPGVGFKSFILGGITATLFGLGLRLKNSLKVNFFLVIFTTGISVSAFETYLEFQMQKQSTKQRGKRQQIAEKMGIQYDTRTKFEVVRGYRDNGIEAYPVWNGSAAISSDLFIQRKIVPLGGVSNKTTVFGNENGYWSIYYSDEYGFNNPKGLYNKNRVDIVLTGDSFTEGAYVKANESISSILIKLGYRTLNFGKSSNGPLLELAALKEYAVLFKPRIVLWIYSEGNDLTDLNREMSSLLLKKYLFEKEFTQDLISRQDEIDSLIIKSVELEYSERILGEKTILLKIWKLPNTRRYIHNRKGEFANNNPIPISTFETIIVNSKSTVSKWNGRLYFVYLPYFERYAIDKENYPNHVKYRETVLAIVRTLNIPIIDIHTEVFVPHPDPLSLFPFSLGGHYNAEGYRLVAEAIAKRLKADGFVPSIK